MSEIYRPVGRGTRVYVDGVFDLLHPGHLSFFERARAAGGAAVELVVGVIGDADAEWKRRPVMTLAERTAMVEACARAAKVISPAPLVLTSDFLDAEGIDLVVHGDDSRQEQFFAAAIARGAMAYVPYTPGVSTSEIIARIAARGGAEKSTATARQILPAIPISCTKLPFDLRAVAGTAAPCPEYRVAGPRGCADGWRHAAGIYRKALELGLGAADPDPESVVFAAVKVADMLVMGDPEPMCLAAARDHYAFAAGWAQACDADTLVIALKNAIGVIDAKLHEKAAVEE